jgi:hypothetical protein
VYVTVIVPAPTGVINPPLPTAATAAFGGVAANVPPEGEPVNVSVDPTHTAGIAGVIVGIALTVICIAVEVFGVHPLDVTVLLYQVVCVNGPGV